MIDTKDSGTCSPVIISVICQGHFRMLLLLLLRVFLAFRWVHVCTRMCPVFLPPLPQRRDHKRPASALPPPHPALLSPKVKPRPFIVSGGANTLRSVCVHTCAVCVSAVAARERLTDVGSSLSMSEFWNRGCAGHILPMKLSSADGVEIFNE